MKLYFAPQTRAIRPLIMLEAFALDRERMKECFLVLDRALTGREFIVGNKITRRT